jgi:hypothetical protein
MPSASKSHADTTRRVRRRRLAIALAATAGVGGLSLGLSGVAGAASSSSGSVQSQVSGVNKGLAEVLQHFNCGTAEAKLSRAAKLDAKFTKHYANLNAHLATEQKAGHAKRVKFYENRLTAAHKEQALLMGKGFQAREKRVAKLAQDKCHITPPSSI